MKIVRYLANGVEAPAPMAANGAALSSTSALMRAGSYVFGGVSYDCSQQGLYRFIDLDTGISINKLSWDSPNFDYYSFISGMCHNHLHGSEDEQMLSTRDGDWDYQVISNRGINGKWRNRCGVIASLAAWYIGIFGKTARAVNVVTNGAQNGFDDGHFVLETLHGSAWRMWDMTNACYFVDAAGAHMSAAALIAQIANGGAFPQKISLDGDLEPKFDSHSRAGNIDMSCYVRYLPSGGESWYRRIFQRVV
ncbi:hypothetical protein Herbaro_09510 [Herbaspirillum sp. WKF16]|uniref:hypothetical protein n=1 Tax=Herbaspirillum sp. WKF16 TaxID=3028312 RepID=UPI0023A95603|nr:hypothetical protein [Herbaspirillum sp. WKF16]WDZ97997.1 hypothetical protein Herbaro_09510 [Herbaspirillum sp. WKF16]